MNIILKHAIKNVFSKKGRTLILIFCILITSFVAMLALDMRYAVENLMREYVTQSIGKVDIMIDSSREDVLDGCEGYSEVRLALTAQTVYDREAEMYSYSYANQVKVAAFDNYENAYSFGQISDKIELGYGEAYITREYAEKYDAQIGDVITLYCADTGTVEVTVMGILSPTRFPIFEGPTILVTPEMVQRVDCSTKIEYVTRLIALDDYSTAEDFKAQVLRNDPAAGISDMKESFDAGDLGQLYSFFYLIFLFTFLLVIFVTVSFSEKIVTERMSVIGTLRSIGTTVKTTSLILLLENVFYGLIGSVLGVTLYSFVRGPFLASFMRFEGSNGSLDVASSIGSVKWYVCIIVIIGAILIETMTPVFAIVKAVKMSIRDIIFANKDTEFKYTWNRAYVSGIFILVAIVTSFMNKSFVGLCISIVSIVVAIAALIPFLLKGISILGEKCIRTERHPLLKLSVKEISNNKTLVNTAVLCISTLILSAGIYTFAVSEKKAIGKIYYDCDLCIARLDKSDSFYYSFIEDIDGVKEVEIRRGCLCDTSNIESSRSVSINGNMFDYCYVFPWDNYTMITNLTSLGEELSHDEIIITSSYAAKWNINVGDTVTVVFNENGFFPRESECIVKGVIRDGMDSSNQIIISEARFTELFGDSPYDIGIRCEEGRTEEVKKLLERYIVSSETEILTYDELVENNVRSSSGIVMVITAFLVVGLGLTIIGVAGNQTIGFENRRREMAVLYSTSMSRSKLIKLIVLENAITIGCSTIVAMLLSSFLIKNIKEVLILIGIGIQEISYDYVSVGIYMVVAFLIVMLTNIIPIRRIKKMNCSLELKYE
ncbi:MAG: ABC transporter permease [Saccharofermentans sp.]|nr:ABC transporter permease [Saccharofermentans sp.]